MAASSPSHMKRYHVFPSFHGPDVRKGFISHLHTHFAMKGITTFKDQSIERGHTIGPELLQAIRESRVSIVVLSKKYASSSWCLDELVEILKCKENLDQIVMTIFYEIDPSDVRKQKGDFGSTFEKTCQGKSEEVKQRWSEALTYVANIAGEHSLNWANEAEMIQTVATDVSKKLNVTPSRDFERMVGLEAHLTKLKSLLCLDCGEVKMIGIWGPAGIGKTTIARALYNQLSSSYQFICFMGNLRGIYKSIMDVDDYDLKLSLQSKLLSKILNQNDMRVHHLGAIKEWLQDQRVLIVLDDVDDLEQLEVLAKELSWFGSGSRIIVTTKDKKILKAHGITDIYQVDFPSKKEALEILCLYTFKQSSVPEDFEELANKVAKLCGDLPLGLCVVGSSLRGESKHEWELQLSRLETCLDRKIEQVLRVGYDKLLKKEQSLFLHIAFLFNNEIVDHVATMLGGSNLDVTNGLNTLASKSLVYISTNGRIVMHYLLQQLGRQVVLEQSNEPGGRHFLVEMEEIRDVLENETGTGSVEGISLDMSKIREFSMSKRAFERMRNLKFLRFYNGSVSLLEDLEYLPRLSLLHWDSYPRNSLPSRFQPERLIELHMPMSNLERLWEGIQPLASLKKIDLGYSKKLIEIPNLSEATNLETLTLTRCSSLVEVPSSISNLHKLKKLTTSWCIKLQVLPTNINLASLEEVDMNDCSRLRSFPDISSNIKKLDIRNTKIEDLLPSVVGLWLCLDLLSIGSKSLKRLRHVPESVKKLDLRNSDIKRIPDCVIGLPHLVDLIVVNCTKLVSILDLPPLLESLNANHCVSLRRVCCPFYNPIKILTFYNCLKLDEEARRGIIRQRVFSYICVPGKEVPAQFTHRATGNSITIPLASGGDGNLSASSRFKACLLLSPIEDYRVLTITCHLRSKGGIQLNIINNFARLSSDMSPRSLSEHLFLFDGDLFDEQNICHDVDGTMSEIVFEFSCWYNDDKIIECGVQLLTEEDESSRNNKVDNFESESTKVDKFEIVGNRNHHSDEAVHTDRKILSGEKYRISIRLWIFVTCCIVGMIHISIISSTCSFSREFFFVFLGSSSSTPEAQKHAGNKSKADSFVARNYNAYLSFHDPDLPREFVNHLHDHFASKGMTFFNDQGIKRGETIGPEFVKAIRESQVLMIVVSPNYASSRWCIHELVEIFNCKAALRQVIVMPIFYKTDPSNIRIHAGDFGRVFQKTCEGQSEEVKQRWSNAVVHVSYLMGELSNNWDDEGAMVEKIATDASGRLNDKFKDA